MSENKKCQFKSQLAEDYTCPELALKGSDCCVFHKPKKIQREIKLFKERIKNKLQSKDYVFVGFCFPSVTNFTSLLEQLAPNKPPTFEKDVDFRGSIFKGDTSFKELVFDGFADFRGSTFEKADFGKSFFNKGVHFEESTFKGDANFSQVNFRWWAKFERSTFKGYASFFGTKFEGDVDFTGSFFEKFGEPEAPFFNDWNAKFASFEQSTFMSSSCFSETVFSGFISFRRSTFKGPADFTGAIFERRAPFEEAVFERSVSFKDSIFPGHASFEGSTFNEEGFFTGTTFERDITFAGAIFKRSADFTRSAFHGNVHFTGCAFAEPIYLDRVQARIPTIGAMLFRKAKTLWHREGNYVEEGKAHYQEMDYNRKQKKWYIRYIWANLFHRLLHGYGEKPHLVILWAVVMIIGCALLFIHLGIGESSLFVTELPTYSLLQLSTWKTIGKTISSIITRKYVVSLEDWANIGRYFYFSVVTFTTLGYGDLRPIHPISHLISSIEAFVGMFMMALFVLTFGRRWRR